MQKSGIRWELLRVLKELEDGRPLQKAAEGGPQ